MKRLMPRHFFRSMGKYNCNKCGGEINGEYHRVDGHGTIHRYCKPCWIMKMSKLEKWQALLEWLKVHKEFVTCRLPKGFPLHKNDIADAFIRMKLSGVKATREDVMVDGKRTRWYRLEG